jgi:hypothetical protein
MRRALLELIGAALAALLVMLGGARTARAHDFAPGVLALEETSSGEWRVVWTEPVDTRGTAAQVTVRFPAGCQYAPPRLTCGEAGLRGDLAFEGLHGSGVQVVITVRELGGRTHEHLVRAGEPRLDLAVARPPPLSAWLRIGAEHILEGADHLAFVAGLLLVVGFSRRLFWTVTAFTAAHSLTLALAALGALRLPSRPVEATIALSVLLVAREALHDEPTWTRRFPWAVAFAFGLVHGLGFAGALADIGLPQQSLGTALLLFNVGVELGQLAVIAAVYALVRAGGERARRPWLRRAASYLLGALAAWWLIDRCAGIVGA